MAYLRQIEAINPGALNEDRLLTLALSSNEEERGLARDRARFTDSKPRLCLLSLSQRGRIGECLPSIIRDSSLSPSPRSKRREVTDCIAFAIGVGRLTFCLLSLSQRERMKVRDCGLSDFQGPTKSPQERFRVLPGLDDSRSGRRQFLAWLKIPIAPDRAPRAGRSHDQNHPIRSQVSCPDNRSLGCKDRWGAVAGIYKQRTFDFEDVAREYVRNRSRSCGGNERASSTPFLILPVCCEKRNYRPLTSVLSPRTGRGGNTSQESLVGAETAR